jgi:ubiquinone biosynthesis protein
MRIACHQSRNSPGSKEQESSLISRPLVPKKQRNSHRATRIVTIVLHHLLVLAAEKIKGAFRGPQHRPYGALQFRRALEDLGPTFVKLGQFLSVRADLVPESFRLELIRLRDHVSTVPLTAVVAEIEATYDLPIDVVFSTFSTQPIAAASMSQVHAATLTNGRRVAVKVRRPGISALVEADLTILAHLARIAGRLSKTAHRCNIIGMVSEFAAAVERELDFSLEAESAATIRQAFEGDQTIVVPQVVELLTTSSVIVMDLVKGIPLSDMDALDAAGASRRILATAVIRANLTMMLCAAQFHADPHPGNFIALPGDRLAILDFGETGSIEPAKRAALGALIAALACNNSDGLAAGFLCLTNATRPVGLDRLNSELDGVLTALTTSSLASIEVGPTIRSLLKVLADHGLQMHAQVALLLKALMQCESTAAELDPTINLVEALVPFTATQSVENSIPGVA